MLVSTARIVVALKPVVPFKVFCAVSRALLVFIGSAFRPTIPYATAYTIYNFAEARGYTTTRVSRSSCSVDFFSTTSDRMGPMPVADRRICPALLRAAGGV